MHPDLEALERIRLDEDQTYAALADAINAVQPAGADTMSAANLHRYLHGAAEPYDRTLKKIRRFLDARAKRAQRQKRRAS